MPLLPPLPPPLGAPLPPPRPPRSPPPRPLGVYAICVFYVRTEFLSVAHDELVLLEVDGWKLRLWIPQTHLVSWFQSTNSYRKMKPDYLLGVISSPGRRVFQAWWYICTLLYVELSGARPVKFHNGARLLLV